MPALLRKKGSVRHKSLEGFMLDYVTEKPEVLFPEEVRSAREHIDQVISSIERVTDVSLKKKIATLLITYFGLALLFTFGIFVLQGFHFLGFNLDAHVLNWLGAATIGELGGLITIMVKSLFNK